jgi:hypothetical protein
MLTEPERMREPMASALARQFESEYATPDLSDRLTSDRNLQNEGIWQQIGGGIADMFGAVGDSMSESARNSLFGRLTAASKESASRDPDRYTREEALPYTGTKAGTEQSNVATAVEAVAENTPRNDASGQDFSIMDQFFDDVSSGDITVQGRSPVQAQGVPSPVEPPPADAPDLSIADLIADQRRMTQANMLMQLGAGIYGGDLSKGLSAAGMAGMKGSQAEQALALKERLAKYQAGRQDIARADKSKQFYDQLKLLEKRYDNELQKSANVGQRELFRTVTALVEAATGEVVLPADQKQDLVESLMNKYLNLYAPSFGVTDIPTLNMDTQKGPRDFKSLARG